MSPSFRRTSSTAVVPIEAGAFCFCANFRTGDMVGLIFFADFVTMTTPPLKLEPRVISEDCRPAIADRALRFPKTVHSIEPPLLRF